MQFSRLFYPTARKLIKNSTIAIPSSHQVSSPVKGTARSQSFIFFPLLFSSPPKKPAKSAFPPLPARGKAPSPLAFIPVFLWACLVSACCFFCLHVPTAQASAAYSHQSPIEFVNEFYLWYTAEATNDNRISPIEKEEIKRYVHPCVVESLKIHLAKDLMDYCYFTQGQDTPSDLPLRAFTAYPLSDTICLVPVHDTDQSSLPRIMVFVETFQNGYRIIKVIGAFTP